jgi:hypothetical protein
MLGKSLCSGLPATVKNQTANSLQALGLETANANNQSQTKAF